ncbi:MAG: GGDEF domain-containing protein [Candidatus Saccharicenans sp.]
MQLIIILILSYQKFFVRYYQLIASFVILVGGGGILAMLAIIPAPAQYLYSQGLMLVLIYNYTFLSLRFIYATFDYLAITIAFEIISTRVNPLPFYAFINNNFFLLSANFIGMVVAYYLERLNRDNFLHGVSMKKMAEVDSLTGLLNRGFFMEEVKSLLNRPGRIDGLSAFCILDLDGFKEINDTLGHPLGDEILINLGKTITAKMRSTDVIGRLGGDEIGFFFLDIKKPDDILNIFEKLKNEFQQTKLGVSQAITFSVGCILFGPGIRDVIQCYARADRALLQAKQKKNFLVLVDSEEKPVIEASLN